MLGEKLAEQWKRAQQALLESLVALKAMKAMKLNSLSDASVEQHQAITASILESIRQTSDTRLRDGTFLKREAKGLPQEALSFPDVVRPRRVTLEETKILAEETAKRAVDFGQEAAALVLAAKLHENLRAAKGKSDPEKLAALKPLIDTFQNPLFRFQNYQRSLEARVASIRTCCQSEAQRQFIAERIRSEEDLALLVDENTRHEISNQFLNAKSQAAREEVANALLHNGGAGYVRDKDSFLQEIEKKGKNAEAFLERMRNAKDLSSAEREKVTAELMDEGGEIALLVDSDFLRTAALNEFNTHDPNYPDSIDSAARRAANMLKKKIDIHLAELKGSKENLNPTARGNCANDAFTQLTMLATGATICATPYATKYANTASTVFSDARVAFGGWTRKLATTNSRGSTAALQDIQEEFLGRYNVIYEASEDMAWPLQKQSGLLGLLLPNGEMEFWAASERINVTLKKGTKILRISREQKEAIEANKGRLLPAIEEGQLGMLDVQGVKSGHAVLITRIGNNIYVFNNQETPAVIRTLAEFDEAMKTLYGFKNRSYNYHITDEKIWP